MRATSPGSTLRCRVVTPSETFNSIECSGFCDPKLSRLPSGSHLYIKDWEQESILLHSYLGKESHKELPTYPQSLLPFFSHVASLETTPIWCCFPVYTSVNLGERPLLADGGNRENAFTASTLLQPPLERRNAAPVESGPAGEGPEGPAWA